MTSPGKGDSQGGELSPRVEQSLRDFVGFAETAQHLVDRGRTNYDADEMLRLAAEAILLRLGESVARLGGEFTKRHAHVSWRQMKGMRNVVAHAYGAIDHALVWDTLEHRLPHEAAEVIRILDGHCAC